MTLDINDYTALTYVRKPYEVMAIEVTNDNIKELAPFIGELDHKNGTPFIKSQKSLVGSTFRVWPGFFVTVLNGKLRCYSRRMFFNQFAEMTPDVRLATAYVLGDRSNPAYRVEPPKPKEAKTTDGQVHTPREMVAIVGGSVNHVKGLLSSDEVREAMGTPGFVGGQTEDELLNKLKELVPDAEIFAPKPQEAPTCEHGHALDTECPYKKCGGAPEEDDDGLVQVGHQVPGEDVVLYAVPVGGTDTDEVVSTERELEENEYEGDFFGAVEPEPVVTETIEQVPTEPEEKTLQQQIDGMMNRRATSESYLTDED